MRTSVNFSFFNEIWYYQMSVSERLRGVTRAKEPKYTKSNPISFEDFAEVLSWAKNKKENKTHN